MTETRKMDFIDWLMRVKGLSTKEIREIPFDPKKYIRLSKQYINWKEKTS